MSRLISWFSSRNGRIFTRAWVGVTGLSIFSFQFAKHGPLQENIKEMVQIYRNGKEKPLSNYVKELVKEVVSESNLNQEEKQKIKFFNVIGHDVFHSGALNFPWGALIGLPFYFEDSSDIDFGQMRLVGQESIDWVIEGNDLLAALTLSEKAKKFAIMREIYSCDIWNILDNAVVSSCCFLIAAKGISRINESKNALEKFPFKKRIIIYAICYTFAYLFYRCLQDPLKHITDKKLDTQSASTGVEYLEGGIEFYEKALLKNKALRVLLGKRGERKYDKDGNENYFIIAPRLPVRKRLEFLQDLKKDLQAVPV